MHVDGKRTHSQTSRGYGRTYVCLCVRICCPQGPQFMKALTVSKLSGKHHGCSTVLLASQIQHHSAHVNSCPAPQRDRPHEDPRPTLSVRSGCAPFISNRLTHCLNPIIAANMRAVQPF